MIKPKFKVGDKVNLKRRPNVKHNILTITRVDIDIECYTCNQGSVFSFDEQNDWKLVERPEKDNMEKPKDIAEFLQRLTIEEQEFLWEHIEKVKKLEREEIMKGAIEASVENGAFYGVKPEIRIRPESGYKTGDRVRVLIIKDN